MLELAPIIISVFANLLLGLFVLLKNPKSATNRSFALATAGFASFAAINYISLHPVILGQLTWIRLDLLAGGVLLFYAVYLTFDAFPDTQFTGGRKFRIFATAYTALVAALVMSPLVFSGLETVQGHSQPVPAPGIALFALHQVGMLLASLVLVIKKFRAARGLLKVQYRFILAGIVLALGGIIGFNLVAVQVFKVTALIPLGSLSTLFFTGSFAYAIVRQRLFDIRLVVARSVAYVLLLSTLAAIYGVAVFAATLILFPGGQISTFQNIVYVALAIVLAFTFQPLRRFFEKITDRFFFRDLYDTQDVLNKVGKILASELLLERLLDNALKELCQSLSVQHGMFMVFNQGKIYSVSHFGPLPDKLIIAPKLRKLNRAILVADELPPGERKQIMDEHGIRLSLVLRTKEEFVGFLLLGDKLSGDVYSNQDLELLEILASELAVAIINAKAYEEISHFNLTLQQKVNEATKRLRVANRNLKALDKAKDEFISMASHQLRTPLTTIKGYLSMIMEGDAGTVTKEQREFLEYAFGGTQRMVALISDLLNVSRLSAGRFMIEKQPVDMIPVVKDEVRQLVSHADAKAIKLVFEPPKGKFPQVDIDEGKTRQVIMNFIDNAIYYTPKGQVTVSLEADKSNMRLKVRDTGIGVPPEAQAKLFTKFFRADNAQATRPDGTGLGLYLAKRVVEDQGGKIIFESIMGKGSTFGFEMPLKSKG